MIEWLRRADPNRPFLRTSGHTWSYAETLVEVGPRVVDQPVVLSPTLTPESVFDVVAGLCGGGLTVVGVDPPKAKVAVGTLVVYTSGTTGAAKAVRLTMGNLEAAARASQSHLGHDEDDDWLLAMPLHHVGGLSILVRQIFAGGAVTLLPGFDPETFSQAMSGTVTMVSVVPTMLKKLIAFGPFSGLKAVLVGGGPIPPGLLEEASDAGMPVLPTYGLTESFGQVATRTPGTALDYRVDPLPGVSIRITAEGHIAVKADQVSADVTGEDGWFVTNDLGEVNARGSLRILGRADTVIVTGGENVAPERVEAALQPFVDDVVVVGAQDDEWGQVVICVFVGDVTETVLANAARGSLPGFMVPKRYLKVTELPKTPLGKPDRSAVEDLV